MLANDATVPFVSCYRKEVTGGLDEIAIITIRDRFVDIGVHQDGLVHISQLADKYVSNPHNAVKVNQKVNVTVLEVDIDRKRISLSMKENPEQSAAGKAPNKSEKKQKVREQKPARNKQSSGAGKQEKSSSPFADLKNILSK